MINITQKHKNYQAKLAIAQRYSTIDTKGEMMKDCHWLCCFSFFRRDQATYPPYHTLNEDAQLNQALIDKIINEVKGYDKPHTKVILLTNPDLRLVLQKKGEVYHAQFSCERTIYEGTSFENYPLAVIDIFSEENEIPRSIIGP